MRRQFEVGVPEAHPLRCSAKCRATCGTAVGGAKVCPFFDCGGQLFTTAFAQGDAGPRLGRRINLPRCEADCCHCNQSRPLAERYHNIAEGPIGQVAVVLEDWPETNMNKVIAQIARAESLSARFVPICAIESVVVRSSIRRAKTTAD